MVMAVNGARAVIQEGARNKGVPLPTFEDEPAIPPVSEMDVDSVRCKLSLMSTTPRASYSGEAREAARRRFRSGKLDELRWIVLVSIDTELRISIDIIQSKSINRLSRASIDDTYGVNRILQCREDFEEFAARHPHPPNPVYVKIDRHSDTLVD
ncbi:hypothetical protein DY000_02062186 [Brassica cretica]|uniref:Uncharacterized protein n=1 Tax=Brassica cretica TaxID=69181 RepID=A0ABQ7AND6_BRACR|nr:hypothetical protein DY000_02062186 [Brassica cretica]